MRRALSVLAAAALASVFVASPAQAHGDVPDEFGTDWDDPVSAAKPVDLPVGTSSCTVSLVDHEFDSFDPYQGTYQPPSECDGDWSKVVLHMDGAVSGRQYDRLGTLTVGGVPIFKTSTPEPSPDGIEWSVDKDVSGYAALLREERDVTMRLGNSVDDTNTGVFDIELSLTFYGTNDSHRPIDAAEKVIGLSDQDTSEADLTGDLTVPRNSERLLADVYATGSGGDCEEFWYLTAPVNADYSCKAPDGPNREVQVLIDGDVAGIAAPYPNVYTGGWSNPYLWTTLAAPRTFDIRPITYDLTPYLGELNDGAAHTVSVRVTGVDGDTEGWSTPTAFRAWQDEGSRVVTGGVLASETTDAVNDVAYLPGEPSNDLQVSAGRQHTATGWLETSHGDTMTTVDRVVSASMQHDWGAGENPDSFNATWTDTETVTTITGGSQIHERATEREYGIDGSIDIDEADRLTTSLALSDTETTEISRTGQDTLTYAMSDLYTGEASWDTEAPREERNATATTREHYRLSGDRPCYDRTMVARNGYLIDDDHACGARA